MTVLVRPALAVLALGATFALGVAVGRPSAPSASTALLLAPEPPAPPPVASSEDAPERLEAERRLAWCEAQLGIARQRIHHLRRPWPEGDLGPFAPDAFDAALGEALEGCDARVIVSECSEFPCLSALRAPHPHRVRARCPGLAALVDEGSVDVVHLPCPDGPPARVPVVWGWGGVGAGAEEDAAPQDTGRALPGAVQVAGRRLDDLLSVVGDPCADGGPL